METENESNLLPPMKQGDMLERKTIQALQRFTQHPPRYNEADLVKKLETWPRTSFDLCAYHQYDTAKGICGQRR